MQNPSITLTGDADTSVIFIMWINVCTHSQFSLTESLLHCIHIFLRHPLIFENKDRNWANGQRLTPRNCVFSLFHSVPLDFLSCQRASASAVIRSLLWIAWIYTDGRITMKTGRWDFSKYINPTIIPSHSIPSHVQTHKYTHRYSSASLSQIGVAWANSTGWENMCRHGVKRKCEKTKNCKGRRKTNPENQVSEAAPGEESHLNGNLSWDIYLKVDYTTDFCSMERS